MARTGNLIEGIFWVCVAIGFLISFIRPSYRRAKMIAFANFLAFGISDFVEMHTGAWWRPWWLMAWKATCVVVMLVQYLEYLKRKRQLKASRSV